jgi:hypothetical protein
MKRIIPFFVFALVIAIPALALGQPCPPIELNVTQDVPHQEWWMVLLDFLVELSAPLVTAILGVLGTWVIRKIGKKWDAEKVETLLRLKDGLVTSGVAFAEEQGRKALKNGEERTASADKLAAATEYVQAQLEQSGVGRMAESELVKLIEARLHIERTRPDGAIPSDAPESES